MNSRYTDREKYFLELARTSKDYYIDYVGKFIPISGIRVLEIGCGEGGNLLPFAESGCRVFGIDLSENKIKNAIRFFEARGLCGEFFRADFLKECPVEGKFDLVLVHDVIEHIEPEFKAEFFSRVKDCLKEGGIAFFGFPAWQMPFGGHQQICRSRMCRVPFIHLLPRRIYKSYLYAFKENPYQIEELMSIKRSKMTVELFESLCCNCGYEIVDRTLWTVSPHYKVKFNLSPVKLWRLLSRVPYLRNFLSASCFYILKQGSASRML